MKKLTEESTVKLNLGLLIAIVVFCVTAAFAVGAKLTSFEDRLEATECAQREHVDMWEALDAHDERLHRQDIILIEIQTDLKWIRAKMENDE